MTAPAYHPSSMAAHKLYVVKGDRNNIVDDVITLDPAQTAATAVAGRVMSLNSSYNLVAGLFAATSMPYFAVSGLDANNYPDTLRTVGMPNYNQVPFGVITYKASVELCTTEFVTGSTYNPGDKLTCYQAGSTTVTNDGLILPWATNNAIVGYVSARGRQAGPEGYPVLFFYPTFTVGSVLANA